MRDLRAPAMPRHRDRAPSPARECLEGDRRVPARSVRAHSTCRTDRSTRAAPSFPAMSLAPFPGCSRNPDQPSRRRARSILRACRRCQRYLRSSASRSRLCLSPRPRSLSAIYPGPRGLEDFLAGTKHFVECFLKIGCAFRKLLSYLRNILFKALFDLLSKELLESSVAKSFGVLRRMVRDDVGDQRPCQALRPLVRIL